MKKQEHNYYKNHIRRIFLLYAIIPVLLLTVICLIAFWISWRYSLEKTNKENNQQISNELELVISEYMKKAEEFAAHNSILDSPIDVNDRVKIFESIYEIANKLDKKAYLYVFDNELTPIISSTKTIPSHLDGAYNVSWGIFRQMNQKPNQVVLNIVEGENTDNMQLLIGKTIRREGENLGYVVFVLDSKEFEVDIAALQSQIIITDYYDWVYAANNFALLDNMNRVILEIDHSSDYLEHNSIKYYVTSNSILNNRIKIYSISSISNKISVFLFVISVLLIVFALMIFFVFISTKKVAVSKTKDIYAIIEAFEKVKEGDLNTHIDISSNDEFQIIGESYNLMLDSLKEQISKNEEMGRLVISSQTKQLESQFNPHFLYNTLENIRYMCRLDPNSASNMIFNLSNLLRYSISNIKEEVTVEEDVVYTENYMSILKYRFNKRFQYSIHILTEVKDCIIPKLILQPMIENSIKYGFEGKDVLSVEIKAFKEDYRLVMMCSDNGAGMQAEVLEEIRYNLSQDRNRSNHSGLYNIHRRVQLKYGEEYGIQIESKLGFGTILKVIIPIKYAENEG